MKVLNWVTRRFLNVPSCIAVLPDMENDHVNSKYDVEETQALLEHGARLVMDIDVFKDWKDGILAIGTLAVGPLESNAFHFIEEVNNTIDIHQYDNHNLNYNTCDNVEENPLMNVEMFSHELENNVGTNKEILEEKVTEDVIELENNEDFAKDEWQTIKKRVTLADLLLADSDHKLVKELGDHKLHCQAQGNNDIIATTAKPCQKTVKMIKPSSRTKQGLSKAKKLLKEDLQPIKKLNQLMERMMKKKIHPDLEGKMQADMEMQPRNIDIVAVVEAESVESASQFLIQGTDAMASEA